MHAMPELAFSYSPEMSLSFGLFAILLMLVLAVGFGFAFECFMPIFMGLLSHFLFLDAKSRFLFTFTALELLRSWHFPFCLQASSH
jgi:hypothetical protein